MVYSGAKPSAVIKKHPNQNKNKNKNLKSLPSKLQLLKSVPMYHSAFIAFLYFSAKNGPSQSMHHLHLDIGSPKL